MTTVRLHLVGFTPDLKGLVFSGRRGGRSGTYWVPVDDAFAKAVLRLEEAREEAARAKARSGSARGGARAGAKGKAKAKPGQRGGARRLTIEDFMHTEARDRLESMPSVTDTQDLPLPRAVPRVESKLTPREIQQMLREGRAVKDVAAAAGVDEAWVERFVGPVREEMTGIIAMTQQSFQSRPRLGRSGLPIGDAVAKNLEARKATAATLDEIEQGWDARRMRHRTWRVRLRFTHRGKRRVAEWEFRTDTRAARPRNKLATDLGWSPERAPARRPELLTTLASARTTDAADEAEDKSRVRSREGDRAARDSEHNVRSERLNKQ